MDNVSLDFNAGFNVLTGQTGAGKSIIIDSINLLTGERSSKELVRSGENKALVEGTVYTDDFIVYKLLDEAGIEYFKYEPLVLSREITKDGRSTVRINNRVSTTTLLRQICARIINIHGQHDNQAILDVRYHREFLDAYAGLENRLKEYQVVYKNYLDIKTKLENTNENEELDKRRVEILNYEINEIESADLKEGEDEELYSIRKRFINNEKIRDYMNEALVCLSGSDETDGARTLLDKARSALSSLSSLDERVKDLAEKATDYYYMIDDLAETLRDLSDDDFDEVNINAVEERIDLINRLKKKHGASISEIIERLTQLKEELGLIENKDINREKLEKECKVLYEHAKVLADDIRKERILRAKELEKAVKTHLESLEMPNVAFKILIENTELSSSGADSVEFLISANKGEDLKPLNKVASGGELSRIILAMKVCLAKADSVETMIFDEIDTGVSGSTSQKIAEKLKILTKDKQIFVITHSPQIAAFADFHYLVEKTEDATKTVSTVKLLDEDERTKEIARIISGSTVTESAVSTAKELIKEGKDFKA